MRSIRRSLRLPGISAPSVVLPAEPMDVDDARITSADRTRNRIQSEKRRDMAEREAEASRVRAEKLAIAELARRRKKKASMTFNDDNEQEVEEDPYNGRQSVKISSQPILMLAKKSMAPLMYHTSTLPPQEEPQGAVASNARRISTAYQQDASFEFSQEELDELCDDPRADEGTSDQDVDQQAEALRLLTIKSGTKRKAVATGEALHSSKVAKTHKNSQPTTLKLKPGARQAQGPHRQVLKLAIALFRQSLSTVYGFADSDQGDNMGGQCWKKACATKSITLEMSENDLQLLKEQGSQLRIELKTKATQLIEQGYGLLWLIPEKTRKVQRLSNHVTALLTDVSFIYRDPRKRNGIYLNVTIYKILVRMYFYNRRSEGIKYEEYSMPISLATIALVLTVIDNVLDEYKTGLWEQKEFSWASYHRRYEAHLQDLESWERDNPEWVAQWTTHLATAARKQLGINNDDAAPAGRIAARDRQEAAARLSMKDLESIGAPARYESDGDSDSEGGGMSDKGLGTA